MKNIIDITNCSFRRDETCHNKSLMVNRGGATYYVKDFANYGELVASELCHLLGIPCVNYQLAKNQDNLCLISKSFRKENCSYLSGASLIEEFLSQISNGELADLLKKKGLKR